MKKPPEERTQSSTDSALTPETDLLYQTLESEMSGVRVYATALGCVQDEQLRAEWEKHLKQTSAHVEIVRKLLADRGLDPHRESVGRQIVRHIGNALVDAMQMALRSRANGAAEIVAAECVLVAETKDHANWSLIGQLFGNRFAERDALGAAYERVEPEEEEHLARARVWARELWLAAIGRHDGRGRTGARGDGSSSADRNEPRVDGSHARGGTRKWPEA
jgi:hypothetical protein